MYLTLDQNVDCLYYHDWPFEVMFIFERRPGQISTMLRPGKTVCCDTHANCKCEDVSKRQRYNCLVLYKNQLFDYNINENYWKNHACISYKKKLDCLELFQRYRIGGGNCRLSCLDLTSLGERIRNVMTRSAFTRLYIDGTLS